MKITDELSESIEQSKDKIGELLVKHSALTRQQLDEALEVQRMEGGLLGEVLTRKNYIHPHDLIKVVCLQVGIPYQIDIKVDEIDPNAKVSKDLTSKLDRQTEGPLYDMADADHYKNLNNEEVGPDENAIDEEMDVPDYQEIRKSVE